MNAFTISINPNKCMVRHGAANKIKYFRVLLYMRSQAESRYSFGKGQGLARRKGKKRVTPEFGEGKEEKNLPPNSGRYKPIPIKRISPSRFRVG
jgi:hypothetical protein